MSVRNVDGASSFLSPPPAALNQPEDQRVQSASSGALVPRLPASQLYLNQFDRQIEPLYKAFTSGHRANLPQMVFEPSPHKSWHLTGVQIGSLLLQLRAAVSEIASIPAEMRANHRIEVIMPRGERVQIKAGMIPAYIDAMRKLLQADGQNLLMSASLDRFVSVPHDEDDCKDAFEELGARDYQEVLVSEKSARQDLVDKLSSWIFDPGNPEKGKKYEYSLYSTRCALDEKFKGWKKRLLPYLREQATKSAFAKNAYFALNSLKDHAESEDEIRAQYAFILSNIREALANIPSVRFDTAELKETLQMILYFCHYKFARVHMYPFLNDFIPKVLMAPQVGKNPYVIPPFTLKDLAATIEEANERLMSAPPEYRQTLFAKEFKKLKGAIGWGFDPSSDSNTPWVHSIQEAETENGPRTCTVLRHSTPTCDPGLFGTMTRIVQNIFRWTPSQQAVVIPEYKAYLAAEPDKVTLYVNHQEYDGTGQQWVTAERDRTRALQQLERDYKNFHFLALPMDGEVWEKHFLEKANMADLKKVLFESLLTQTNGFAFPRNLMKEEVHQNRVKGLLEDVHKLYFGGQELDTPALKKAFMMLFYSELKDYLKNVLKADFVTSPCKDHKDRGNASTTVDMMNNLVKLGLENDPNLLREVFISILGPFIIKNEHIIETRLEIALNVIRVLSALTEAQKLAIREKSLSGYRIKTQTVPKEAVSWSQMVGAKKFIAFVDNMKRRKERRVVPDDQFQQKLVSTYLVGGQWNLDALRKQIVRDMPCCEIRLNQHRMLDFDTVCKELDLNPHLFEYSPKDDDLSKHEREALRFLSTLHQGAAAESMRDPSQYLNGNGANLTVAQPILHPSRDKIHKVIVQARNDLEKALVSAKSFVDTDSEFENYLRAAVSSKLLPEPFLPAAAAEVPQFPIYPTRIHGKFAPHNGSWELTIEQELDLRDPEGVGAHYPISALISAGTDHLPKLSWNFTA